MKSQVFKAGIWNLMGSFVVKGMSFITIPIYTYLLSPAEYGMASFYLSVASIIISFAGLGAEATIANARIDYKDKFSEYLSSVLLLPEIVMAGLILVGILIPEQILYQISLTKEYYFLIVIYASAHYMVIFLQNCYIVDFRYKENILVSFLSTFGNVTASLFFIILIYPNSRVFGRMIGNAFFDIIIAIIAILVIYKNGKKIFDKVYLKYCIRISLPQIWHSLAAVLLGQFDRIAIISICGEVAAGLYGTVSSYCMVLTVLFQAINGVWVPWLFRMIEAGEIKVILNKSRIYLYLFSFVTICMVAVLPDIIKLLSSAEYFDCIKNVVPCVLGGYFIFLYTFFANLEFYYKKNLFIAIGTTAASVINIVLNFVFIQIFGYYAAAYTTMASYGFLFFFHWIITDKILRINIYSMHKFMGCLILVGAISTVLYCIRNLLVIKYSILIVGIVILVLVVKKKKWLI